MNRHRRTCSSAARNRIAAATFRAEAFNGNLPQNKSPLRRRSAEDDTFGRMRIWGNANADQKAERAIWAWLSGERINRRHVGCYGSDAGAIQGTGLGERAALHSRAANGITRYLHPTHCSWDCFRDHRRSTHAGPYRPQHKREGQQDRRKSNKSTRCHGKTISITGYGGENTTGSGRTTMVNSA